MRATARVAITASAHIRQEDPDRVDPANPEPLERVGQVG